MFRYVLMSRGNIFLNNNRIGTVAFSDFYFNAKKVKMNEPDLVVNSSVH